MHEDDRYVALLLGACKCKNWAMELGGALGVVSTAAASSKNFVLIEGMEKNGVQVGEMCNKHTYAAPAPRIGHCVVTPT